MNRWLLVLASIGCTHLDTKVLSYTDGSKHVLFVDDNALPGGNGETWATAFRHLQDALTVAREVDGSCVLRIAQGTYNPDQDELNPNGTGNRSLAFELVDGVEYMGGFAGVGAPDPDLRNPAIFATILSGDLAGNDDGGTNSMAENSFRVANGVNLSRKTVIDGLTIRAGNSDGAPTEPLRNGAGLNLLNSDPLVRTCIITKNHSPAFSSGIIGRGGGVFVASGHPVFVECTFSNNFSGNGGAGVGSFGHPIFLNCNFQNNIVWTISFGPGGGFYCEAGSVHVYNCQFTGNVGGGRGGAFATDDVDVHVAHCTFNANRGNSGSGALDIGPGTARIYDCIFTNNDGSSSGAAAGGAISIDAQGIISNCRFIGNFSDSAGGILISGPTFVSNCWFESNRANSNAKGGAIWATQPGVTIANSVFWKNVSNDAGGAARLAADSRLVNCAFVANVANGDSEGQALSLGGGRHDITNCIFWNNGLSETDQIFMGVSTFLDVNYSCIMGWTGAWGGVGNSGQDPRFTNAVTGDFRLLPDSPFIDAGDVSVLQECLLDLDGKIRTVDTPQTPDTGAGPWPMIDRGPYEFNSSLMVDCNANHLEDECELLQGVSTDCNGNLLPDECDLEVGSLDCNINVIPDECETALLDCNANQVPDDCDLVSGTSTDCNANGTPDECDLSSGTSADCNGNQTPDECEIDCNGNGVPDDCDLLIGTSVDANNNAVPDECEAIFNVTQGSYFMQIGLAIQAAESGDEIVVQPGIYLETISFLGKDILLRASDSTGTTVLEGNESGPVVEFAMGETSAAVLDGFIISGGVAELGGGIYIKDSSPTIRNCTLIKNIASSNSSNSFGFGGGLYCTHGNPTIVNCAFAQNLARNGGGAHFADRSYPVVVDCSFRLNSVTANTNGGGAGGGVFVSTPEGTESVAQFTRCNINENTTSGGFATTGGGGMYVSVAEVRLTDCKIGDNVTNRNGGGVLAAGTNYSVRLIAERCIVTDNSASLDGGGIHMRAGGVHSALRNCLVAKNAAGGSGGGLYAAFNSNPWIVNSTIAGNQAPIGGGIRLGESQPTIISTVIWGNSVGGISNATSSTPPFVLNSNVEGGFAGYGNINTNPGFANAQAGDFHFVPGSPCIDSGNPGHVIVPNEVDLDGEPRVLSCRIDMGCYETASLGADCNANSVSDGCDLIAGISPDCNMNGVPDECDLAGGTIDCNGNGVPDTCDTQTQFTHETPRLEPFALNLPQTYSIPFMPSSTGNVVIKITALVQGYPSTNIVQVRLNGVLLGAGISGSNSCPASAQSVTLNVSATTFNQALAQGSGLFEFKNSVPDHVVCPNSFVSMHIQYPRLPAVADCNANGVPDDCDVLNAGMDCNHNDVLDSCESVFTATYTSPQLSPIGSGSPQSYTIVSPPRARSAVQLTFAARADLSSSTEFITVHLNNQLLGDIFVVGNDCPSQPNVATLMVPVSTYNALVFGGGNATITMNPSSAVSPTQCNPPSYIAVNAVYQAPTALDTNGNGIIDACECVPDVAPPDGNGEVNVADLLVLLSQWGMALSSSADLNFDGLINGADLNILISNWGPCQ